MNASSELNERDLESVTAGKETLTWLRTGDPARAPFWTPLRGMTGPAKNNS